MAILVLAEQSRLYLNTCLMARSTKEPLLPLPLVENITNNLGVKGKQLKGHIRLKCHWFINNLVIIT